MFGFGEDCCCVQGIEHFIDPRLTLPQWDFSGEDLEIPIWQQNRLKAIQKKVEEEAATEDNEDVTITSEQLLNLVVQGLVLTNKAFVHLTAFQMNSYYIKLESLDTKWLEADTVSLIFSHNKLDQSIIIPVPEIGKEILIPNEVLIPGELNIVACTLNNDGTVSSMLTNSITYQVYDQAIKPIDFGEIKTFELYYYFLSTVLKLQKEIEEQTALTASYKQDVAELKSSTDALATAITNLLEELL